MNILDTLTPALLVLGYALILAPFITAIGKVLIDHWWRIKIDFYKMLIKDLQSIISQKEKK